MGDIEVQQSGIGTVLRNSWLHVPKYQREYSWEERHVMTLFQDFKAAVNQDTSAPYFLGTIVTVGGEADQLLVVDGQQRLATTSILLGAMREYLRDHEATKRAEAIERLLWEIDSDLQEEVPKLTLNVDDADLFRQIVTGAEITERSPRQSHRRLLAARDLARKHVANIVAGLAQNAHSNELNRWIKFIQQRAEVIVLTVPDRSAAFRMFQTLNDRGLSASKADLIKSHLFEKAGKREADVERGWSNMRMAIETAITDDDDATLDFLRYALIVQRGHMREAALYDHIQKMVDSEATAAGQAGILEALAATYVATTNPQHERWNGHPASMRRALTDLGLLNPKPMRPLIVAVAAKMPPREAADAMTFLASLAVRLNIASNPRSGAVEEPLGDVAPKVYDGTVANADALRTALSDITPSDASFREGFLRAKVSNARLARYYLRTLEYVHAGVPVPHFEPVDDAQSIDLEHVLPRRPEAGWYHDEDEVSILTTRLGNLALLHKPDNSKLKSKPFDAKKLVYAEAPYALTRMIAAFPAWTGMSIDIRQETMADLALRAWPIRAPQPTGRSARKATQKPKIDINETAFNVVRQSTED